MAGWQAAAQGEGVGRGAESTEKQPGQVTRLLRRLHAHGLIAKVPRSRRWRVSLGGRRLMASAIKLREVAFLQACLQDARSDEGRIYRSEMAGLRYKLAHKRVDKTTWSASERAQRKRLVQILREVIADLERKSEPVAPAHEQAKPLPRKLPHTASRRRGRRVSRRRPPARPVRRSTAGSKRATS